jgi:hypothetical protein
VRVTISPGPEKILKIFGEEVDFPYKARSSPTRGKTLLSREKFPFPLLPDSPRREGAFFS